MWIDSSCLPIHRGVKCTTLVGEISTWVGNRWLSALNRLARNTSPDEKGRPFRHTSRTRTAATAPIATIASVGQLDCVMMADVKLFWRGPDAGCRVKTRA